MRNALVLVPLCIGLTSGFIVPNSTSEVIKRREKLLTSNAESVKSEITYSSIKTDSLHLYHNNEEEIRKEILRQGSDDNKNINERSFVFVNQRWKKIPYKSHLVGTRKPNLNSSKIYQDVVRRSENNEYEQRNNTDMKNLRNISENKKYFPPNNQLNSNVRPYYDMYGKKFVENKKSNQQGDYFVHHIKEPLIRQTTKSDKNINLTRKDSQASTTGSPNLWSARNTVNFENKYAKGFNKLLNDVKSQLKNYSQIHDKENEINKNVSQFKDMMHEVKEEENIDSLWGRKLFHLTLEEQIPHKQILPKYNTNNISNFKYCQECTWKVNPQNYNSYLDVKCKCRCGRYIHLKGPQKIRDLKDKRRSICKNSK